MIDLWPEELKRSPTRAPISILREQAKLLAKKTGSILDADAAPLPPPEGDQDTRHLFLYGFFLLAPALQRHYHLFTISHQIALYPASFHLDEASRSEVEAKPDAEGHLVADSEEAFRAILRQILAAPTTQQVISSLLAQSEGYDPNGIAF